MLSACVFSLAHRHLALGIGPGHLHGVLGNPAASPTFLGIAFGEDHGLRGASQQLPAPPPDAAPEKALALQESLSTLYFPVCGQSSVHCCLRPRLAALASRGTPLALLLCDQASAHYTHKLNSGPREVIGRKVPTVSVIAAP